MRSSFRIDMTHSEDEKAWRPSGIDEVAYMISTNPGEPMRQLEHIASGGRVRLARLADDIADRKPVIMYDFTRCDVATDPAIHEESPQPTVEVRPYITVDSDLSLYVRER